MQNREMTYVQISRAKQATRLYADALDTGPNREGLYAMLERSAEKLLAHDLLDEDRQMKDRESELDSALRDIVPPVALPHDARKTFGERLRIDEAYEQNQKSSYRRQREPRLPSSE